MSESDKEGEPSSVSSVPGLLSDLNDANSTDSVYRYRDFSHVGEEDDAELAAENPPPTQASRGNSESSIRVQKFPVKLYAILAQKEFQDIITWLPHGRSWKVLKPSLFESMVMPLFFEYSNYHSFNRLVNAWSFRRISSGPDRGSYYHELFLRGMPHLQKYMRRLPKTHKKLPMSKKDEPDFYALDKTNPLPPIDAAPVPGAAATSAAVRSSQQYQQQQNSLTSHYPGQQQQGSAVTTPSQPRSLMRAPGPPGPAMGGMNPQTMQNRYMRIPQEGPGSLVDEYYDNSLAAPASPQAYPGAMNASAMPPSNGYGGYPTPSPMRPTQMRGVGGGGGGGPNQFYQQGSQYSHMDGMMQHQQHQHHHHQQQMESFQGGYGSQLAQQNNYYQQNYRNSPVMSHQHQQMGYGGYDGSAAAAGSLVGIRGGGMNFQQQPQPQQQQQQQQQQHGNDQGESGMLRRPVPRRPVMGVE